MKTHLAKFLEILSDINTYWQYQIGYAYIISSPKSRTRPNFMILMTSIRPGTYHPGHYWYIQI